MKIAQHNEEILMKIIDTDIQIRFHDDIQPGVYKVNVNLTGDFNRAFALVGDATLKSDMRKPLAMMVRKLVESLYVQKDGHARV